MESKQWIVLKFGGTSVSNYKNWQSIAEYVIELQSEYKIWITLSALAQVMNRITKRSLIN